MAQAVEYLLCKHEALNHQNQQTTELFFKEPYLLWESIFLFLNKTMKK
jgi:hypothetical protein